MESLGETGSEVDFKSGRCVPSSSVSPASDCGEFLGAG